MTYNRINRLAKKLNLTRYLEIGVKSGDTFLNVNIPNKVAIDPNFLFDKSKYSTSLVHFFEMTSDEFFKKIESQDIILPNELKFDIIYIDGLHTYEQSYKDFINTIPYSHNNTIWIFDDTVPWDPWSAIADQKKSYLLRSLANIKGKPWHGDVFKTIFTIHDFHPEFSYATQINLKNPQTVVWKSNEYSMREKNFFSTNQISKLSYFDIFDNLNLFNFVESNEIEDIFLRNVKFINNRNEILENIIKPLNQIN